MNLGAISTENEEFINDYKSFGFKTKTEMANEAFKRFREIKAAERRALLRREMFASIANEPRDYAWEGFDDDDFVADR